MINGVLLFENGGFQQIGELTTLSQIIATIKQILPELEQKELKRILESMPREQLQQILAEHNSMEISEP